MTKEELKQEAEEWIIKNSKEFITNPNYSPFDYAEGIYLAGAEPREKRISELERNVAYYAERAKHAELAGRDYVLKNKDLGKRCLQLQKDKGNLTDKVRELEQQIEKMKCCENCQHWEGREPIPSLAEEGYYCFNDYPFECKRWELAEELKEIKEK